MKFFDRDLSWLSFNYRVLMEAMDTSVPLLERLRFIAIISSNLDEFFRVRVASIRRLKEIDKKNINKKIDFEPASVLDDIHKEVEKQLSEYGSALQEIISALKERNHIICTREEEIADALKPQLLHFFKTKISAFIKPLSIGQKKPVFLDNQAIYLAVEFADGAAKIVNIPSVDLGRFSSFSVDGKTYYIFLDDIIRLHLDLIFPGAKVTSSYAIKLNKDSDLQIDDEFEGNLVKKIEKQIQKRNLGIPSRFLFDS